MPDAQDRRAEISHNLTAVRARISEACAAVGRSDSEITLVAVTKFFPASDAAILVELGVHDLGENRDQEAAAKVRDVDALLVAGGLARPTWHFIGQLQTNKAKSVVRYADMVHSVDRPELVRALSRAVANAGRNPLDVLIQVSLDHDPHRGGGHEADVLQLASLVADESTLSLRGVMSVPPVEADPDIAFERLAGISARLVAEHPQATLISAGMTHDLEQAVKHGATHVRIGTALLGRRRDNFG